MNKICPLCNGTLETDDLEFTYHCNTLINNVYHYFEVINTDYSNQQIAYMNTYFLYHYANDNTTKIYRRINENRMSISNFIGYIPKLTLTNEKALEAKINLYLTFQ